MITRCLALSFHAALVACGGGGGSASLPAYVTADPRGAAVGGPGMAAADAGEGVAREIEEADLVRVDGDRLLLASAYRGLVVVDLAGSTVVGRLPLGGVPRELLAADGRALVFVDEPATGLASLVEVSLDDLVETGRAALGGAYRAARLVGQTVVVVTDRAVSTFAVGPPLAPLDTVALPSGAGAVHVQPDRLVVAGAFDGASTPLTVVDLAPTGDLSLRGTATVPGWVADDQKLDLHGPQLRVVSHDAADGSLSRCLVLSLADPDAIVPVGALDLVRGEQLFATRFDGDRVYIVTFEQIDPLWVVDLSVPTAPAVTGVLEVPGWSVHLVPTGDGRLVAVGIDPDDGWRTTVSLFSVSDPSQPTLLSRLDFGWGWSTAFGDVRALGVHVAEGLVTVPLSAADDRLVVLTLGATSLALRGHVALQGPALRGFPHPRGLVAVSQEEVVVVDPETLATLGRAVVAEHVVDVVVRPGGDLPLVARRSGGRLGDLGLPLVPERAFVHGEHVAVVGWDDEGRAAVIVALGGATPTVSPRIDLGGWGGFFYDPAFGVAPADGRALWVGGGTEGLLTSDGHLVVRGLASTAPPSAVDGLLAVHLPSGAIRPPVHFPTSISGLCADAEGVLVTVGRSVAPDGRGRPRMRHDLVRVDPGTGSTTAGPVVPGYVVAATASSAYLVEESWGSGWSFRRDVVAVEVAGATATVASRRRLPDGAFDLRAAGDTFVFTTFEGGDGPGVVVPFGGPPAPRCEVGVVRLAPSLTDGPRVSSEGWLSVVLVEPGALLVSRDGVEVTRYDVGGGAAQATFTTPLVGFPLAVRPGLAPGTYVVALGYGGVATLP